MEGSCSTGQSPQRAVVPVEEEEEEEEELLYIYINKFVVRCYRQTRRRGVGRPHKRWKQNRYRYKALAAKKKKQQKKTKNNLVLRQKRPQLK
jgi:hypothetical protein